MKKNFIKFCCTIGLAVLLGAVSVQAQKMTRYTGNIPFDFNLGQKVYQAGVYTIEITKDSDKAIMRINDNRHQELFRKSTILNRAVTKQGQSDLLFTRYADKYFLTDMATPEYGVKILKPDFKKWSVDGRFVENAKITTSHPETVAIALTK